MSLVQKQSTRKLLEEATQKYSEDLWSEKGATGLEYLTNRGLTKEVLESFRIGVVADPLSVHEQYRNRIAFPYLTPSGVVNIRFRRIGDDPDVAKYLSIAGDVPRIYNVRALKCLDTRLFICEGETDVIAASMAGLTAVGIPGVSTWNDRVYPRIFRDVDVCVLPDNDDSGEGKKLADTIYRSLGGCDVILMPRGYDVSKYVYEHGPKALREKVGFDG